MEPHRFASSLAEFMDPLRESSSQLKVGLKRDMSHTPGFNPTLKLALTPVIRGPWIRAQGHISFHGSDAGFSSRDLLII